MVSNNHRTNDDPALEQILTHNEIPPISEDTNILQHDGKVFLIHDPGEVTRITATLKDDGSVYINSLVRITNTIPGISPADDVFCIGRITYIDHGPGRQTRVLQ